MNVEDTKRCLQLTIELTEVYTKKTTRNLTGEKENPSSKEVSADSQTIKYADILDNCNEIIKHDRHFSRVIFFECKKILDELHKGNRELYNKTEELLNNK